jgi:hypothetical protein
MYSIIYVAKKKMNKKKIYISKKKKKERKVNAASIYRSSHKPEGSVCLCFFYRTKNLYRWSRLVVSFCILLSDWFFFLGSDFFMDTGFCHLIGQTS